MKDINKVLAIVSAVVTLLGLAIVVFIQNLDGQFSIIPYLFLIIPIGDIIYYLFKSRSEK